MKNTLLIIMSAFALAIITVAACELGGPQVNVTVIDKSRPGGTNVVPIDECIAPIVAALNKAGIETVESCCGHGTNGFILLKDRVLIVTPKTSEGEARKLYHRDWSLMSKKFFYMRKEKEAKKEGRK